MSTVQPADADSVGPGAATRLLVLGAVRIFQPVHGYSVRRELASWNIGEWASIHPGSIYNALRGLSERGLLEEAATESHRGRPARTTYRLTPEGENELLRLLRAHLSGTDDPTAFLVAVNLSPALPRAEVIEAVEGHVAGLRRHLAAAERTVAEILASLETPDYACEVPRIIAARVAGELTWAVDYLDRVRAGGYAFGDEEPDWHPTDDQVAEAAREGALLAARVDDARPDAEATRR